MDLWDLIHSRQHLDPEEVARAIEVQAAEPELDYRTRMLISEAAQGLRGLWGEQRFQSWMEGARHGERIAECAAGTYDKVGFPSLQKRIQVTTKKDTILDFLAAVGQDLREPVHVIIGGSSALILADMLERHTEDVDVVDEVPEPLRKMRYRLGVLQGRFGLHLAHFQSHYLPTGWERRTRSVGTFRRLTVDSVEPLDVAAGKLLSRRDKDVDDLRALRSLFTAEQLRERVLSSPAHLKDPKLLQNLERNWNLLYREPFRTE